jgi:hypothetical protein
MVSPRLKELLAPHLPHVMRMVILSASKTRITYSALLPTTAALERLERVHRLKLLEPPVWVELTR